MITAIIHSSVRYRPHELNFFSRLFTDDCQMVIRAGRAGVLLDPPHRHEHVHPTGPAASAIQRPWSH